MKKPYSLDYSIERDVDRMTAVETILSYYTPNPDELEQMGTYILYGKDEDGLNAFKRHEIQNMNKRYNTYMSKEDKNLSLDAMMDNPIVNQANFEPAHKKRLVTIPRPKIEKPKYDKAGNMIDPGDSDIPGMVELWDSIERLEKNLAQNEGRLPPDKDTFFLANPYRVYQLRHYLVDLRRQQYMLKDAYKPTIRFLDADHPKVQFMDWDSDSFYWIGRDEWQCRVDARLTHRISPNLEDYEVREDPTKGLQVKWVVCQHTFDWENMLHVRALLNNYPKLYVDLYDRLDTDGRALLFDLDYYIGLCRFSPSRALIIQMRVYEDMSFEEIAASILERTGIKYSQNHVSAILNNEIATTIATTARRHRLLTQTPPDEMKRCFLCGRFFPRDTLFFGVNNNRRDHFESVCKECGKKRRIRKGEQSSHDKRYKDSPLFEM